MPVRRIAGRKVFLTIILFLGVNGVGQAAAKQNSIFWFKDLEKASEAAQKTNQPMMIDFWADWCAPCKLMDAEVYGNPAVISSVGRKIVAVRIHFDLQPEMVRKFNVTALPYLVFTNSYGTELLHHSGMLEADDLTALVNAFPDDVAELNRLDRILQEDKNHFEGLLAMGRELRAAEFFASSNDYYERAVKQSDARKNPARRESILFEMGWNSLELQDGKTATSTFERCLKEFPESERKPEILLGLGRAHVLSDRKEKARRLLNSLIAQYPQSEASIKARTLLNSL